MSDDNKDDLSFGYNKNEGREAKTPKDKALDYIGNRWSLRVILTLQSGTLRYGELERITGISPRSLTQTLRHLERDGLIERRAFATIPPKVEYSITEMGKELAYAVEPVIAWATRREGAIEEARRSYDAALPTA